MEEVVVNARDTPYPRLMACDATVERGVCVQGTEG